MDEVVSVEDYIDRLDGQLHEAAVRLRDLLDSELSTSDSLLWEGRPTWIANKVSLAAVESTGSRVKLTIFRGDEITDSTGTLKLQDNGEAILYVESDEDIDDDLILGWLHQVQQIEG